MSKFNISSMIVIRDRALNLCADIQAATSEFGAIRTDMANESIAITRNEGESDTKFLQRLATDLTVLIQKEQNRLELESIMTETGIPHPDAVTPNMTLRRPVSPVGRMFNKAARFFG